MVNSSQANLTQAARESFRRGFGEEPDAVAFAPGRVNLLGEHTDYNGGFVLPIPLGLGTAVAIGSGAPTGQVEMISADFPGMVLRPITDEAKGHWSDYLLGALLSAGSEAASGLRAAAVSDLPVGAGLSSSAAIEVAALRALAARSGSMDDPVALAMTAKAVENNYIGLPCGIMDQFAASVGTPGQALFLNTRSLDFTPAPLLAAHRFLVIHSGVSHALASSGYATRVAECADARTAFGVDTLSDLGPTDQDRIAALPDPIGRRALHVVTDNALALAGLAALQAADASRFGDLMTQSHATARNNYEITVPETDEMVAQALNAGALGARQTGGGWGGSIVVLVNHDRVGSVMDAILVHFPASRHLATV
jgi:galactokinase